MSTVLERQTSLRSRYQRSPALARITKRARTGPESGRDPFHGIVTPDNLSDPDAPYGDQWRYGIDAAIGGLHDAPNPAEMLCGALAACTDGTVRMIAELIGIELDALEVEVTGDLDVRGTLMIDPAVAVGFQQIAVAVRARATPGSSVRRLEHLAAATERCCIVLDTLRHGVAVDVTFDGAGHPPLPTAVPDTRPASNSTESHQQPSPITTRRHQCHSSTSS